MIDVNLIGMQNDKTQSCLHNPFNGIIKCFNISQQNFREVVDNQKHFLKNRFRNMSGYPLKV